MHLIISFQLGISKWIIQIPKDNLKMNTFVDMTLSWHPVTGLKVRLHFSISFGFFTMSGPRKVHYGGVFQRVWRWMAFYVKLSKAMLTGNTT